MHGIFKIIIVLSIVLSTCCDKNSVTKSIEHTNGKSKEINIDNLLEKKVLLEVSTKLAGMVKPSGELLDIRLYSTGEVDYEEYLSVIDDNGFNKKSKKSLKITEDDFQELKKMLEMSDLINAKTNYLPTISPSDVSTTTTIIFNCKGQQKKIVAKETDTTLNLERKKNAYPESLINLLKIIARLRSDFKTNHQDV